MGKITLAGTVPQEQQNGLGTDAQVKAFMEHPRDAVLVVAVVSRMKLVTNDDKSTQHPVLRIRHWEVVPDDDRPVVADVLQRALASRTGLLELPFEPGEEIIVQAPEDGEDPTG